MENRLKEERLKQKISQEELAMKASVSRVIISGIESGRVTVTTTDTLSKLAVALNKQVRDIFF